MTKPLDRTEAVPAEIFPMPRASGCPFDPPPRLQELQQETAMTVVEQPDGKRAWLITRYADQRTLLADKRVSADITIPGHPNRPDGEPVGLSFITMDDPEHARLRRMVTAPFMIKRIEAMRPAVQRIVDDAIDAMLGGPRPVDLVEAFALPVPSLVICELLGVPYSDHDLFQMHSRTIIRRNVPAVETAAARQALIDYLTGLVAEKRRNPREDVLSQLGGRVDAGELTEDDAARLGVLLLIAGHETTANMIALGTAALLQNPAQLDKLRRPHEPELVKGAVEELLRYLHITHNGRKRVALEDIEFEGETIRAGDGLIMANDIGNRDPEIFDDPDTLDLERDSRRHVAFGFGIHQCLGQSLARMELQVVYSTLYRRIPSLALAVDIADVPFKHDGNVYGVYELPVTW
nr:cytochrome P450 [Rhodococcus sp. (in: high G+C Gram-positive bacteria)]